MSGEEIVPRKGWFQWAIRDRVIDYEETEATAWQALYDYLVDQAGFYDGMSPWSINEVLQVIPTGKTVKWADGERSRTVVVTRTVASGFAHHADHKVAKVTGIAQGRVRA